MTTHNFTASRIADRVRAGEPIGVGIIGLGGSPDSWAETAHLPALRAIPGYEIRGVSASSHQSARIAADRHGIPRAFATAAELAAHDSIDLVVISVRVPVHAASISAVLDSGNIIFSEWPLAVDTAEAQTLTAQAAALGVRTAVGLQARFNPPVRGLSGRPSGRGQPGTGHRGRRTLHGRGQARRFARRGTGTNRHSESSDRWQLVTAEEADQPPVCVHCRRRPAAFVLDRLGQLGQLGQALSGSQAAIFPVWACENCVQEQLNQVLDIVSMASVCRADSYRS